MLEQDELLASFVEESLSNLQTVEPDLLMLEKLGDKTDSETINRIFRKIHSVKGAAGFFGLKNIGSLSHIMENILSLLRNGNLNISAELVDALLSGVDALRAMVEDVEASDSMDIEQETATLSNILQQNDLTAPQVVMIKPKAVHNKPTTDIQKFTVSEHDLNYYLTKGYFLYSIKIYLNQDLRQTGKTPFSFINTMESLGHFVDAFLNVSTINGLADCLDNEIAFNFLFATVLEHDLVPKGLELPEDRVTMLDIDEYRYKHQNAAVDVSQTSVSPDVSQTSVSPDVSQASVSPDVSQRLEFLPVHPSGGIIAQSAEKESEDYNQEDEDTGAAPGEAVHYPGHGLHTEEKIRVGVNFLNELVNLAGELVLGRNQLLQKTLPLVKTTSGLNPVLQHISRVTSEMQEKIMQMRMQPISLIISKFHRLVRTMAKNLNKEIKMVTYGEEVELDKTIIEGLSDPLTHLIRNAIDHGIEVPDEREKLAKPRQGTVELRAYHQGGQVHIKIRDDGRGINSKLVAQAAMEKGVINYEQMSSMSEKEIIKLIFKPGFSTAKTVTNVSGRGVGMDVVLTNIERLGGSVDIDSKVGKGTQITLILPLTLAIVSGLLVNEGRHSFIIPEVDVDELVRVKPEEVHQRIDIVQRSLVLRLRDMLLPLINLGHVLGLSEVNIMNFSQLEHPLRILVVKHGNHRFALIVESIVSIEEIVVKSLPRYLKKLKCFSGVSILGNGAVALILDVAGIVKKARIEYIAEDEVGLQSDQVVYKEDIQTLLLFNNNTQEQFALPLELISRVERAQLTDIERIKDKHFLQYHGKKLRLVFLEDYLPISKPDRSPDETIGVIVPKQLRQHIGIVIHRVINTISTTVDLDTKTISAPGLFGSSVINGRITLIPDMYRLLELVAPEWHNDTVPDFIRRRKQKPKILLVDDTSFFRMVESEYLVSAGYDVITAEDGQGAMQILEEQKIDAVLLDIIMPKMDGWEVIKAIRNDERMKNLPVMAVSSLADNVSIQQGLKAGFNEWESKLDKTSLLKKLESILA